MTRSAAIYCRISKDRTGAGLGVDRQRSDCEELAARLGWTVAAVHTDNDISAYSGKPRPGYRALLEDIASGRIDAVIAWHNDRLHRSPAELEGYISVCEARGAPTHCVKAGPLDLSTPSGRLVARQLGAVARYEVDHLIDKTKAAKLQAARAGKYRGGRRAFGYDSDGVTVRPLEAALVADASKRVLHGETLASIAREWNARGVLSAGWHPPLIASTWTSIAVHKVLIRPRNAGLIEIDGEQVAKACWPAIVGEDVWRAVRALLGNPSRRRPRSADRVWLGSGLFRCGVCNDGTTMRSASSTGGATGPKRPTYRCKNGAHLARVAEPVDIYVTECTLARLRRPDARLLLRRTDKGIDTEALGTEAQALRVRLDELAGLFAVGAVTASQLAEGTAKIRARISECETQLAAAAVGSPLAGFVGTGDDVENAWQAASVSRRKAVIDALMVVTLLPAPRGRRPGGGYFDPDCVEITWRT
ncbi:MAG TPA: recombinase family protein [Pseudonocardiaceae bacterium]|nr:recombinase family protein [Pseudonocardiaceae bacterium]